MREARTAWNEAREWSRRSAAFRWASSTTPAGCWTWASAHRPNLWVELDAAFDAIAAAVGEADPYALALALVRFRGVILSASGAYSREQATEAKTTPGSGGAPC